jgi:hypothetical protein
VRYRSCPSTVAKVNTPQSSHSKHAQVSRGDITRNRRIRPRDYRGEGSVELQSIERRKRISGITLWPGAVKALRNCRRRRRH